jgi:hypothetical protein
VALARFRDRRQRRNPPIEKNITEERLRAVVGTVALCKFLLRGDIIE